MTTIDSTQIRRITGIGSLPHHNSDTALAFSLKMGIPFLPQIPIRNPWEFMIAQATEGLPGLQLDDDGSASLNLEVWQSQSHLLDRRLEKAFSSKPSDEFQGFEDFEPSASISSCWQPFLWELQEREIDLAKIQLAGPMTCQWALRLKDGSALDRYPNQYTEISTQIFRLVLARSLAMVKRMQASLITPILYLDEPGLYALSVQNPRHMLCLQELKLMIQTLQKQGAQVGLHCCSDTQWDAVLGLGIDILSIDTQLSLTRALASDEGESMKKFIEGGGRLSLGVIPTTRSSALVSLTARDLVEPLLQTLNQRWEDRPDLVKKVLSEAIFTPACGLAFQSPSDAEMILEKLVEVYESVATS